MSFALLAIIQYQEHCKRVADPSPDFSTEALTINEIIYYNIDPKTIFKKILFFSIFFISKSQCTKKH